MKRIPAYSIKLKLNYTWLRVELIGANLIKSQQKPLVNSCD